ncbi:ABC transporter permease [Spirochaetia bacterium]|nr:ABC transporter permease [Spirochaetia bacterium]
MTITARGVPLSPILRDRRRKEYLFVASFLVLPVLLLVVFSLLPVLGVTVVSFFRWDGLGKMSFRGFDYYKRIFTEPEYWRALLNSLYYLVGAFVQLALAMLLATILTFTAKGKGFFKGMIFFPYLINGVAAGYMFYVFFEPSYGTLNSLLSLFGGTGPASWLTNGDINNILLAIVSVWRFLGLNFIMFLGVIASIDTGLYEAADLDGANSWQVFRYIIMPSIRPIVFLNMILAVKGAISVFDVPYIITGGSFGTSSFVIEAYRVSFGQNPNLGLGSAMSTIILIVVLAVTGVQQLFFGENKKEGTHYAK